MYSRHRHRQVTVSTAIACARPLFHTSSEYATSSLVSSALHELLGDLEPPDILALLLVQGLRQGSVIGGQEGLMEDPGRPEGPGEGKIGRGALAVLVSPWASGPPFVVVSSLLLGDNY